MKRTVLNLPNPLPVRTCVEECPIEILYEDAHYVVFDKPAGLLVIPTPKNEQRTLVNIVNQQYAFNIGSFKLYPCHQIDRETSGAIIFAKGKRCQKLMMDLFKKRVVIKKYIAFIHGRLIETHGEFRKLVKDIHKKKFHRNQPATPALTRYRVVKSNPQFSVVEVRPITGRTNQIRIHFSEAGHPLLGERKYAFAQDYSLKFRRTVLHAASLELTHPVSQRKISVESTLPKDMKKFLTNH